VPQPKARVLLLSSLLSCLLPASAPAADVRAGQAVLTPTALTAPAGHWVLSTYDGLMFAGTYALSDHIEATALGGGAVVAWLAGGRLKARVASTGPLHVAVVGEGFASVAGGDGGSTYRSMAAAGLVATVCLAAGCGALVSAGGGAWLYRRTDDAGQRNVREAFAVLNTHVAVTPGVRLVGDAVRLVWTRLSLDLGLWCTPLSGSPDVIPVVALSFGSAP
jgi:hypothetical protein